MSRQASAEIVVTPELIDAGVQVWDECHDSMDEFQLLERVYNAMRAAAPVRQPSQISLASSDRAEPVD